MGVSRGPADVAKTSSRKNSAGSTSSGRTSEASSSSSSSDSEGEFDDTNNQKIERKHKRFHCVIRQESYVKKVWDVLFGIVLLYVATLLPFKISFVEMAFPRQIVYAWWDVADAYFFDPFFILDLLLNFFFTYYDEEGREVRHFTRCALRYLRGSFLIDFIACMPQSLWEFMVSGVLSQNAPGNDSAKMFRIQKMTKIARLVRLTRLMKIVNILKTSAFFEKMNGIRAVRMVNFLCALTFLVHVFACMWYYCAALHEERITLSWVANRGLYDGSMLIDVESPVERWVHSMYFVLTVITSVGYGDMCAYTSGEIVFVMMLQLVGVFVSSTLMSLAIQIAASGDEGAKQMLEQKKVVRAFAEHTQIKSLRGFELGESLSTRVRPDSYDRAGMQKLLTTNVFSREIILQLPKEVFRGELLSNKLVRACKGVYRALPPRLTVLLALACQQRHFMPEEFVYYANDQSWTVFLVFEGIFSHVAMPSSRGGQSAVTPSGLRAMENIARKTGVAGVAAAAVAMPAILESAGSSLRSIVGKNASAATDTKSRPSKTSRIPSKTTKAPSEMSETMSEMPRLESMTGANGQTNLSPYQIFCKGNVFGEVEVFLEGNGLRKGCARCESGSAGPHGIVLGIHKSELSNVQREFPPCGDAWRNLARRHEEHRKRQLRKLSKPCTHLEFAASTIQTYWRELRNPVLRAKRYQQGTYKLTAIQRKRLEGTKGVRKATQVVPSYVKDLHQAIDDVRSEVAQHEERTQSEIAAVHRAILELHRAVASKLPPRSDGCKRVTQGRIAL